MEQQIKLFGKIEQTQGIAWQPNKLTLEYEKEKFVQNICNFICQELRFLKLVTLVVRYRKLNS